MDEEYDLIQSESNGVIEQSQRINIENQEDLVVANNFLGQIKDMSKKIKEYWELPKKAASEAHKDICKKEKEMLEPLQDSEKIIKQKMSDYREKIRLIAEQEEQRQKEERQKLIEAELKRAEDFSQKGDALQAEIAINNAILIQNADVNTGVENEKVEGLSFRKDYEILVVDETKVPSYINGTQIRKVDTTQIKKFIKMTNNQIPIPRNYCKTNRYSN